MGGIVDWILFIFWGGIAFEESAEHRFYKGDYSRCDMRVYFGSFVTDEGDNAVRSIDIHNGLLLFITSFKLV